MMPQHLSNISQEVMMRAVAASQVEKMHDSAALKPVEKPALQIQAELDIAR